jgi:ketosteroid isomerase-like protein
MKQMNPEAAFREFIDAFNREDLDALDDSWTSPLAYATNSEVRMFTRYRDYVNFDGLRASGWASTRINTIDVLLHDRATAIAVTNLTRLTRKDTELAAGTLAFVLVNSDNEWKLRFGLNFTNLPTLG